MSQSKILGRECAISQTKLLPVTIPVMVGDSFVPVSALKRGLTRLGKERLLDECKTRKDKHPNGLAWNKQTNVALADLLVEVGSAEEVEALAAEGLANQRIPSVGGPSWQYSSDGKLNGSLIQGAMLNLVGELPSDWQSVSVKLDQPGLLWGIVTVKYVSFTPQPIGTRVELANANNAALILLDSEDSVSTVSARSDEDALTIGAAWSRALGSSEAPVPLSLAVSKQFPPLSQRSIQLLEAVYARIAQVVSVINVDRVWVKRADPAAFVQETYSKGEANHILLDGDVKASLCRGDHLTGIAFQVEWKYDAGSKTQRSYLSHVTLSAQAGGPMVLNVTRGGQSLERAAALYQLLRRAISSPSAPEGMTRLQQEIESTQS